MNVMGMERPSVVVLLSSSLEDPHQGESTLVRHVMLVMSVQRPALGALPLHLIRKSTLEKSSMNVIREGSLQPEFTSLSAPQNPQWREALQMYGIWRKVYPVQDLLSIKESTQKNPYKSSECGKAFQYSLALVKNQRIHTGAKPLNISMSTSSLKVTDELNIRKSHIAAKTAKRGPEAKAPCPTHINSG